MKTNFRKAVCLVLAVCLAMLGSCAFAAAIDMTVFEENEDVVVTWDEMDGTAQAQPADLLSPCLFRTALQSVTARCVRAWDMTAMRTLCGSL